MFRFIFAFALLALVLSLTGQESDFEISPDFSFKLYKQQTGESPNSNFLFSPYSILQAMAMTYDGAQGKTKDEMAQVLGFDNSKTMGLYFNRMNKHLLVQSDSVNLAIANALWAQKGYRYLDSYFSDMLENYNAPLNYGNFKSEKGRNGVARKINQWVSLATHKNIEQLVLPNHLQEQTRLVLANAMWFNANWQKPFNAKETRKSDFYNLNGVTSTVPMMHNKAKFNYAKTGQWQAVEMPYKNEKLAMLVILPTSDSAFTEIENIIDANFIDSVLKQMESTYLHVQLPKFSSNSELKLKTVFQQMGMQLAFTDSADFSGITGKTDLKIDKIIHKTTVEVSETGTEAAAATAVIMIRKTAFIRETNFTANHPFIYLIRDLNSGQIIFMGRFVNVDTGEK